MIFVLRDTHEITFQKYPHHIITINTFVFIHEKIQSSVNYKYMFDGVFLIVTFESFSLIL